jgi:hypothetical protein
MIPHLYSQIVAAGLILPKKSRYTLRDVKGVMINSLFKNKETITFNEAVAIVKCSAIFHDTDWSNGVKRKEINIFE